MIFMKDGEKDYLGYCKQIKFVRMEDVFREIQTYKTDNFKGRNNANLFFRNVC